MYAWLVFSILSASFYSILLHSYPGNEKFNVFKLNFFASVVWMIVLFFFNQCKLYLNKEIILFGVAYGVAQTLFALFKAKAMNAGSVSVTTLIGNASLVVSILFSSIVWNEKISLFDICGVILLIFGMILSIYKKNNTNTEKCWKIYVLIFFLFASAVGIIFKGFGKSTVSEHTGDMLLVSSIVMTVLYGFILLTVHEKSLPFVKKKFFVYVLAAGLLSCLYNRINITLSSLMEAVIFFPAFNGGVVVASGALSGLIYKEKFSKKQLLGFALSLIAIFIIGVY